MSELFQNLGIEWHLIIAQAVNFAILAFVLLRFVYRPLMNILRERQARIGEEAKRQEDLAEKLEGIEEVRKKMLADARQQSEELMKEVEKDAAALRETIRAEARAEAAKVIEDGRRVAALEREKIREEIKKEAGTLIAAAVEAAVGDVAPKSLQGKLVNEALRVMRGSRSDSAPRR